MTRRVSFKTALAEFDTLLDWVSEHKGIVRVRRNRGDIAMIDALELANIMETLDVRIPVEHCKAPAVAPSE